MKIAPLIHSRTFESDYNIKFAVRPEEFENFIQWARNNILPATGDLDIINDVRYVVASKSKLCIAGIACTMKFFVESCLTGDDQAEAKDYMRDVNGRNFGVFIGYVFEINANEIPDISYSDLWKTFKDNLSPVWNRKIFDTVIAPYTECKSKLVNNISVKSVDTFNNVTIYESNESTDEKLFEKYMSECEENDFAFCSNISNIKIIDDTVAEKEKEVMTV